MNMSRSGRSQVSATPIVCKREVHVKARSKVHEQNSDRCQSSPKMNDRYTNSPRWLLTAYAAPHRAPRLHPHLRCLCSRRPHSQHLHQYLQRPRSPLHPSPHSPRPRQSHPRFLPQHSPRRPS